MKDSIKKYYQHTIGIEQGILTEDTFGIPNIKVYRNGYHYGIKVKLENSVSIFEEAESVKIYSMNLADSGKLDNEEDDYWVCLEFSDDKFIHSASELSERFQREILNPDNDNKYFNKPLLWWNDWQIFGDRKSSKTVYSVIVELYALLQLDPSVTIWQGPDFSIQDIVSDGKAIEVKSSTDKTKRTIQISNQFQLMDHYTMYVFYYLVEESAADSAFSINILLELLEEKGYNKSDIDERLISLNYIPGMQTRDKKYKILEEAKYLIDENFPIITQDSFVGGMLPKGVVRFKYEIDLNVLTRVEKDDF